MLVAASVPLLIALPLAFCASPIDVPVFLPPNNSSGDPPPAPNSPQPGAPARVPSGNPAAVPSVPGPNKPSPTIARKPLPISIEVDGRFQKLVDVPEGLFEGWTANLTQSEIGGGVVPGQRRGTVLYPRGSLADHDLSRFLSAIAGAARTHVPANATGVAALDFEDGLYPWAERAKDKYKDKLTDAQFEERSHRFFVRSLRAAKAARPNAKWCYWGYPYLWHNEDLIRRMADIYAECDAIGPSLYIRRSAKPDAIKRDVATIGKRVAFIKSIHPRPKELVVAAYLWDKNAANDHQRPRATASTDDMLTTAWAAEEWADELILWVAAGTEAQAQELNRSLAPGGHIRTFLEKYRSERPPGGGE
jgi:Hyaluronidase